ncbi:MAG: hypothetical protein KKC64_01755 [Spirochaetes bacterium]|nr:hypothetical protein [Spirochaetota bacterium]
MMYKRGSATLQVLTVLLFLCALGAAVTVYVLNARTLGRRIKPEADNADLFRIVSSVAALLAEPSASGADTPQNAAFTYSEPGYGVSVRELSSLINPNWLSISIVTESNMAKLMSSVDAPYLLQQSRFDEGISLNIGERYSDYFIKEAFDSYLSPFSYLNIDVVDEYVLERVVAECSGDAAAAAELRQRVRRKRESLLPYSANELVQLFGVYNRELSVFITNEAQWNVNFIDPLVLRAVLAYPAFQLENADIIAATILGARGSSPLTVEILQNISDLPATHRLFAWIGDNSWFWEVTVHDQERQLKAILARVLPTSYNDLSLLNPVIQLIQWEAGDYEFD